MFFSSVRRKVSYLKKLKSLTLHLESSSIDEAHVISATKEYLPKLISSAHNVKEQKICISLGSIIKNYNYGASHVLIDNFVSAFFSETKYHLQQDKFANSSFQDMLQVRLETTENHLPTLDYSIIFNDLNKDLDLQLSQSQRAALYTRSALNLYQQFAQNNYEVGLHADDAFDKSAYEMAFACSVTATTFPNKLVVNNDDTYNIGVLCNGNAYAFPIIGNNDAILSIAEINAVFKSIIDLEYKKNKIGSVGYLTAASRAVCYDVREKMCMTSQTNEACFNALDTALFIVCLDDEIITERDTFIGNCHNRWFGQTQIYVDRCEGSENVMDGMVVPYLKGLEGKSALDVAYYIANSSRKAVNELVVNNNGFDEGKISSKFQHLPFIINEQQICTLKHSVGDIEADTSSEYLLNFGENFFKNIGISPNIGLNVLLMLATYELNNKKLPVLDHAVSCRKKDGNFPHMVDWVHIPHKRIYQFLQYMADKSQIYSAYQVLRDLIIEHQNMVKGFVKELSPTYFISKPDGEFYNILCEYYVAIGGAYGKYLFREYRNPNSLDIITSSLSLAKNDLSAVIQSLGRFGTKTEILGCFGLIYSMSSENTLFGFIPNKKWANKIPLLIDKIQKWLNLFEDLCLNDLNHRNEVGHVQK